MPKSMNLLDKCEPEHSLITSLLTLVLCIGLVISYLPQHLRIIRTGTSEGLSPWFLLLGSTSSAAGFLNLVTVQHVQIRCCSVVSIASCMESTAGIVQVGLQWAMFSFVFILYIIYFPDHLKYETTSAAEGASRYKTEPRKTKTWAHSLLLAYFTVAHFVLSFLVTLVILFSTPSPLTPVDPPSPYPDPSFPDPDSDALPTSLARWALLLGVSSAALAAIQYLPQIAFTWRARLVGALSVPMMCVQSPGAVAMVTSIALRPGTNWTSWVTYAVAGMMQFTLLGICVAWKLRQRRLHIDDFGEPLPKLHMHSHDSESGGDDPEAVSSGEDIIVPGLVVSEEEDAGAVRQALESALGDAVSGDVREGTVVDEQTPLLEGDKGKRKSAGWW
ncbi:unnamed protein product [Mycena citricolor]|uniref:Uncharacterized protein n=1 Tax=Mycena citricolor TaxID=2018698 RepID=A0AAD2HKT2_9AGAR|nr:unnamed protein product [Mycena citricolor]